MYEFLAFLVFIVAPIGFFILVAFYCYRQPNTDAHFNREPLPGWNDADYPLQDYHFAVKNFFAKKKNEWAIIGLVKQQHVRHIYVQKGKAEYVYIDIPLEDLIRLAVESEADTIVLAHNHPEITPPSISKTDMVAHNLWKSALTQKNIGFSEYVCASGIARQIISH